MSYTHLHVHTLYSLLDANIKLDELFDKVKELGQNAVAITDHGNMYGSVEFYKKAKLFIKQCTHFYKSVHNLL